MPSMAPYSPIIRCKSSCDTLGDSITNYGIDGLNGSYSNSYIGWCNDYMAAAGGVPFDVVNVYSAPSKTLEDVISTQLASSVASGTALGWLHAGINNLNSGLGANDTVLTMLANFKTIIDAESSVKSAFIVDSINPVSQSGSTGAKGRAFLIPAINAAVRELCSTYRNVIFNDTYSALVDPTSASNNPLANMLRTDDGIHYLSNGAQTGGKASFLNIQPRLILTKYKTPGSNVLPAFSGAGGTVTPGTFVTITGTPPVGWELLGVSGASASQAVTISSVAPDMTRLAFTNTGSAATTYLRVNNLQANFSGGQTVQGGFGFQASGLVNLNRIALALRQNGSVVWNGMGTSPNETSPPTYPNLAHSGFRTCPPWAIPAGSQTNFEFIIAINNGGGASGASTIDIYSPQLFALN